MLKVIARLKEKLFSFFIFRNVDLSASILARVSSLSSESCEILLKSLLKRDLSPDSISEMIGRLTLRDGIMYKKQREEMLCYLLSQPISEKQMESIIDACCARELSKGRREKLWEKLSNYAVPVESVPALTRILIESKSMQKQQREEMLSYLLSQPISEKQMESIIGACCERELSKEKREKLWEKLSDYAVPVESVPVLTRALIESKGMRKQQREEMLSYLLSCPISEQQLISCFTKIIESCPQENSKIQKMLETYLAFERDIKNLTPWIDEQRPEWKNGKDTALKRVVLEGIPSQEALLDLICNGNLCYLKDACIEFIDRKQLWLMMEELLFSEEYYCRFSRKDPYVLDCGTNIGMAIYYIKHYYPDAEIEGFEPWNEAFSCALRNVERNGWKNVVVHHAAVGEREDETQLTIVAENSLAGSLVGRLDEIIERKHWEKSVENVKVVKLSDYINRPVDFIKMDIEGLENAVLEEIKEKLPNVSQMFVEYHYGSNIQNNSLTEILKILSDAGFIYEVSKSLSYTELTKKRPFMHVGKMVSELIWAAKRE